MKKIIVIITVWTFCLGITSRGAAGTEVIVCGTGDSQRLLRALATAFENNHKGATIKVPDSIGSSGGIRATAEGKCDIGRIARKIKEKEQVFDLQYKLFAYTPVVFLVNPSVRGISNLSPAQIIKIFSGQATNWGDLGGEKAPIYVANRESGDSSRETIERNIPGFSSIENFAGKTLYSTPETIETITRYQHTIGYGPLSMAEGTHAKVLKFNGVLPSGENLQKGKYPLKTPLGIVWKRELKGTAREFIDYLDSPEAEEIILEHGAVPPH